MNPGMGVGERRGLTKGGNRSQLKKLPLKTHHPPSLYLPVSKK
jgi:hypothetical protein